MFDQMLNVIESMLEDDNGVNEKTYFHLLDFRDQLQGEQKDRLVAIMRRVNATDNRFYLP